MPQTGQGSAPQQQIAQFRSDGFTASTGLRIPFFSDDFSRAYGLPPARLVNMMSEATPLREERPYVPLVGMREIRYSRPGLVSNLQLGTGPTRGLWQQDGFLGLTGPASIFWITGTSVYLGGSLIGAIPGTDRVRFAASPTEAVFCSEGAVYYYNGAYFGLLSGTADFITNSSVMPPCVDVAWIADVSVYAALGTNRFYFSQVNDAPNVPALNFEGLESADPIVGLTTWNNMLVVFGTQTTTFFSLSGNADAPFTPVLGNGFERGCASRDAVAYADNAIFWVGENRVVYRSAPTPTRVSGNSLEDKLRQCANISALTAFVVTFEGHELYVLNVPGVGTWAYDISRIGTTISTYGDSYTRGEWDEWESYGRDHFRGCAGVMVNGVAYVGDDTTNDLFSMQMGVYTDAGGPLTRMGSIFVKIEEGNPRCLNMVLQCVTGVGNPTGLGVNPVAEMRYSDDGGHTFGNWRQAPLGMTGGYATRALWQRLGKLRSPGRLVQVRVTDPVNACFSHMELNASRPAW
jgi:hypothetical protein